jgi:hypothetical protein
MKSIYKSTKVIHDAHMHTYEVYYRNWFFWKYECGYKYDPDPKYVIHYCKQEDAKERAIERASNMLKSSVVWQQSNFDGYC